MNSTDDKRGEKDKIERNEELSIAANKNESINFVSDQQQQQQHLHKNVKPFIEINNDVLLSSPFMESLSSASSSSSSSSSSVSSYVLINDINPRENVKAEVHQIVRNDGKVYNSTGRTSNEKKIGKIVFESECQNNVQTEVPDEEEEDDEDGLLVVLADDERAAETANLLLSEDVQPIATLDCCRSGFDDYEEFNMCLNQMLHDDEANGLSPSAVIADTISMDMMEQQSSIYQQQQRQQRELIENLMLEYDDEKKYQKQILKPEQKLLKDTVIIEEKDLKSVTATNSDQATISMNITNTTTSLISRMDMSEDDTNKKEEQVEVKSIDENSPKAT